VKQSPFSPILVHTCFEPNNNQYLLSSLKDAINNLDSKVLYLRFDFWVSQEIFTKTLLGKKEREISACGVKR
jgi:hypothetical protein